MRKAVIAAIAVALIALTTGSVEAQQNTVVGDWTLTIEGLPLHLVLAQKRDAVTGTMAYPHGSPFQLNGAFKEGVLTFSADSTGDNFTVHIDSTGSLQADGTMTGTIKAHFIEMNDAHQVVRTRDQDIEWTAARAVTK
jgi:hypothetical protein